MMGFLSLWHGHYGENFPSNIIILSLWFLVFWEFLVFLHRCAVQLCCVDQDSILFLRKVRFSHVMGNEKVRKMWIFHEKKEMSDQHGMCICYTTVKIGKYPNKRKIEGSKRQRFGIFCAEMHIFQFQNINVVPSLSQVWSQKCTKHMLKRPTSSKTAESYVKNGSLSWGTAQLWQICI